MKPISLFRKDLRAIWRQPGSWLLLAVVSFIHAWLFWQMLDRYFSLQSGFAAVPNPPTLTSHLLQPAVLTLGKLLLLVMAVTTSLGLAQERAQKTLWYLMLNQQKPGRTVWAKYRAQLLLLLFVWLHLLLLVLLLTSGGELHGQQVMLAALGLTLFCAWSLALGLYVSSLCNNTGMAVTLILLVFILLWFIGGEQLTADYGVNWLVLLSPATHLRWLCAGEVNLASLVYFVLGTGFWLWLAGQKLKKLKDLQGVTP